MKKNHTTSIVAAITCAAIFGISTSSAVTVYGLTADNNLVSFDSASPGSLTTIGAISAPGIVDIDFFPANGKLYGMTSTGLAYGINTTTGAASLLVTPGTSLSGVQHFDFNPAADRIRISVSGGGNYRMVPDFTTAPSASAASGTVLNDGLFTGPAGVGILALAYNNNFDTPAGSATTHATTLYSIGSDGVLYSHSTASGGIAGSFGQMTAVGSGLGFAPAGPVGFDIAADNSALVNVGTSLYSVDLISGAFTSLGSLSAPLASMSIVPEPSTCGLAALAGLALLRRGRRNDQAVS